MLLKARPLAPTEGELPTSAAVDVAEPGSRSWNAGWGLRVLSAMSIETLNTAARAAGFAMATSDEASQESKAQAQPETEAWRAGEAILLEQEPQVAAPKAAPSATDWVKSLFGVLGRRAPA
jgi:hypothetical protein